MPDVYSPAPAGRTETAAPQVTTPSTATEPTSPQATPPAGSPQAQEPAGQSTEQAASDHQNDEQSQDGEPKTWKEKRQERNRQRWQEYREAKTVLPQRLAVLEQEVARLRGSNPPDFSQITDPTEQLAERTSWKVRQQNAADAEARLQSEREQAARETETRVQAAWQEQVEDARVRLPDFDKVVTPQTPVHPRMAPLVVDSDKGADIVYYLGNNLREAQALAQKFQTDPASAYVEFGRLEARLSAPAPKPVSTAPRPAPALNGGVSPMAFDVHSASVDDVAAQLRKAGLIR